MSNVEAAPQATPNPAIERDRKAILSVFGDGFFKENFLPVMVLKAQVLVSPHSISFYKRDYKFLSRCSAFEYGYRSWQGFNQSVLDTYAQLLSKKNEQVNLLLDNHINRLTKLLKDNQQNLDDLATYFNVMTADVPIISSHARNFLLILKKLDRVYTLASSANLLGIIDSAQRNQFEDQSRRAVRAFSGAIRQEVHKLYREANRLMHDQHAKGESVAPDQQQAVAEHGKEMDGFEAAAATEAKHDKGLDLQGQDPSQFIDEAAAGSVASPKPKKPKAEPTAPPPGGDSPESSDISPAPFAV